MQFIRWGLYGILLTPLLVSTRFTLPFMTPKVLAFQILVDLVLAGACLVESLRISRGQGSASSPSLLPSSPISIALAVSLGYSIITAAFGADLQRSLWGLEDRQDGLVLLSHLCGWFLVLVWLAGSEDASNSFNSKGKSRKKNESSNLWQWERYFIFSYWVSSVVALSAIVLWLDTQYELFGLISRSVIESIKYQFSSTRSGGVMGNPEYLGPYLLFHLFYGLYLMRSRLRGFPRSTSSPKRDHKTQPRKMRIQLALIIFAEIALVAAIFVGETRGVILGLGCGLLLLAAIYAFRDSGRKTRIAGICACLALIIGSAIIWHSRESAIVQKVPGLGRLVRGLSLQEDSAWVRLRYWNSALSGFKDHPVLGWGHDNAFYSLNKYYNPELVRLDQAGRATKDRGFRQTWTDKSHNAFLDLLVEKGIAGLVLLLTIVAVLLGTFLKLPNRDAALHMASGFLAYAISNLVAFDTFGSYFGLFLFLGWCELECRRCQDSVSAVRQLAAHGFQSERGYRIWGRLAASAVIVAACATFLFLNVQMGMASAGCAEAAYVFPTYPEAGLALYQDAFQHFFPYSDKEKLQCAAFIIKSVVEGEKSPAALRKIDLALQLGQEAVSAHSRDAYLCLWLGQLYTNLGINVDKKYLDGGASFGEKALKLSPMRQEVILHLGRTYVLRG